MSRFDTRRAVERACAGKTRAPDRVRGKYRARGLPLDPLCPNCRAPECHPNTPERVLIRAMKFADSKWRWWSQCLVCASSLGTGGYDEDLNWLGRLTDAQREQGWFIS